MDATEKQQMLFTALVLMLHAACMQQLGKIKHPATGQVDRNLDAAQDTIDLLDMLKEKTAGNRTADEDRMLTQVLSELKLNYVDEVAKPGAAPPPHPEEKKS